MQKLSLPLHRHALEVVKVHMFHASLNVYGCLQRDDMVKTGGITSSEKLSEQLHTPLY